MLLQWQIFIPFCGFVVFDCIDRYRYHNFFILSSVDGHLGFLHVLVIINNAAVNIGVHASFQISDFIFIG